MQRALLHPFHIRDMHGIDGIRNMHGIGGIRNMHGIGSARSIITALPDRHNTQGMHDIGGISNMHGIGLSQSIITALPDRHNTQGMHDIGGISNMHGIGDILSAHGLNAAGPGCTLELGHGRGRRLHAHLRPTYTLRRFRRLTRSRGQPPRYLPPLWRGYVSPSPLRAAEQLHLDAPLRRHSLADIDVHREQFAAHEDLARHATLREAIVGDEQDRGVPVQPVRARPHRRPTRQATRLLRRDVSSQHEQLLRAVHHGCPLLVLEGELQAAPLTVHLGI